MKKDVFLDLNKVRLYGYEIVKSAKVVESIIKGIFFGDKFPSVDVYEFAPGEYLLLPPEGGHCRATGHYIENQPLRVNVFSKEDDMNYHYNGETIEYLVKLKFNDRIWIGDIILGEDTIFDNVRFRSKKRKGYMYK